MRGALARQSAGEYVAIDLELTGLDPRSDQVISFGAVVIGSGRIDLSRSIYSQTSHDRPPARSGVPIHGLRPVDLDDGIPRERFVTLLSRVVEQHEMVVWSAWVEASFLAVTLGGSERKWRSRMIDVRDLVARLDHGSGVRVDPEETLVDCAARFGVPLASAHHALGDALMTAELFLVVARRLDEVGKGRSGDRRRIGSTP